MVQRLVGAKKKARRDPVIGTGVQSHLPSCCSAHRRNSPERGLLWCQGLSWECSHHTGERRRSRAPGLPDTEGSVRQRAPLFLFVKCALRGSTLRSHDPAPASPPALKTGQGRDAVTGSRATNTAIPRVRGTGASWRGPALGVLDTHDRAWLCHPPPVPPHAYPLRTRPRSHAL